MATHSVVDRSEDERLRSALMVQVAEGNERALTRFYDGTNRMVYGLWACAAHFRRFVGR